ncbi:tyrosine-type recombinase/integrase [Streptomyces poriferorum]|uniref:Tyrosine-type recombinase/integrase n=1 Tax=Streptomyces poriferorum TaxID=2798799 RepID=A0ABY9IKN7_9ACTN|nr:MULTISPECIES: tyrosine-type recombinase/integrase [unclassified Streptomyces]MDP5315290.1 tyrosine-type recombinase/integrase [Streptomyces sp. Alt4]WLQ55848.1 tyrosine-type recombinase/integrase [Streptomyces sp. Alt2]
MNSTDLVPTVIDVEIVEERPDLTPELPDAGALPDVAVDINEVLTEEAEEDLANSGRQNTRTTYNSRFKAFASWCVARGRKPGPRTTEVNLASYVSHLRREQIGHDTIRLSIAAIVDMNARAGHEKWPPTAKALKIYADARHEQAESGRSPRSAPPIDMERLIQMVDGCPDTLGGLRDKVICYLGYYCRGRRSELAKFSIASVEFVSDELAVVRKWTSKNDKTDAGREYEIDDPKAVSALRQWITALQEHGQRAPHLPLLRRVDQWGTIGAVSKKGWGMTPHAVNEAVKRLARRVKLDVAGDVTSHGLRAGIPTDLGRLGYSAGEIKEITNDWSSTEQVEKYRKIGRRRAGKKADDRRSKAITELQQLRPEADPAE